MSEIIRIVLIRLFVGCLNQIRETSGPALSSNLLLETSSFRFGHGTWPRIGPSTDAVTFASTQPPKRRPASALLFAAPNESCDTTPLADSGGADLSEDAGSSRFSNNNVCLRAWASNVLPSIGMSGRTS